MSDWADVFAGMHDGLSRAQLQYISTSNGRLYVLHEASRFLSYGLQMSLDPKSLPFQPQRTRQSSKSVPAGAHAPRNSRIPQELMVLDPPSALSRDLASQSGDPMPEA